MYLRYYCYRMSNNKCLKTQGFQTSCEFPRGTSKFKAAVLCLYFTRPGDLRLYRFTDLLAGDIRAPIRDQAYRTTETSHTQDGMFNEPGSEPPSKRTNVKVKECEDYSSRYGSENRTESDNVFVVPEFPKIGYEAQAAHNTDVLRHSYYGQMVQLLKRAPENFRVMSHGTNSAVRV